MLTKLKKLIKSFSYAFSGIIFCIRNEINFRIHIVIAFYAICVAIMLKIDSTQFIVLLITIGFVISMEAINTSIETTIDLVCHENNPLAKIAKDTAAGAVLISAIVSVLIGIILFFKPQQLYTLLHTLIDNPFYILILIISICISLWFIFKQN